MYKNASGFKWAMHHNCLLCFRWMDPVAPETPIQSYPTSVQLVANNVYAQVRQLLKYPKRGRRVCAVRADIRSVDADYFKDRTLSHIIELASTPVCSEWWIRYVNEHGDANELLDFHAAVKVRKHRRDTHWVKSSDGSLLREQSCRTSAMVVRVCACVCDCKNSTVAHHTCKIRKSICWTSGIQLYISLQLFIFVHEYWVWDVHDVICTCAWGKWFVFR